MVCVSEAESLIDAGRGWRKAGGAARERAEAGDACGGNGEVKCRQGGERVNRAEDKLGWRAGGKRMRSVGEESIGMN